MNYNYCYHSIPGVRTGSGMNCSYCCHSKTGVRTGSGTSYKAIVITVNLA